ncbi:MAG: type I 3-dehydroquinate dehydratase [Deltaproteobacteria bacterium]|nr:type I 3-dehydroquinate dehydratase [Deltaproteobacteria bacterium]
MLCITGMERTTAALAARLAAHPGEQLHELRLDALDEIDDGLWSLVARHGARLVVCCRPPRDDRRQLLLRAQAAGARWVDVEEDVTDLEPFERDRLVLSFHDHRGTGGDLTARARAMGPRAAVVKLAITVQDVAELQALREARRAIEGEAILIGMGAAGLLSRTHYQAFGSKWTYVAAAPELATAPGQLDVATAKRYGMPASSDAPFLALVGGPQITQSPGPQVYNRLFRDRALPHAYVALVTASLARALPLLEELGAIGLSVTMPLKEEAAALAIEETELGVANTLRRAPGGWRGTNTDVMGVREPLAAAGATGRALILGAGGAARAAWQACAELGLEPTIAARSPARATFAASVVPWEARAQGGPDLLINATPIGGDETPWPPGAAMPPLVFDLAIGQPIGQPIGRHSRLLDEARSQGSATLDAMDMWVHQGAAQLRFLLGADVAAGELRERLP